MWKITIAILLVLPAMADDRSKQTLTATHTDQFQASAPGAIRLENAFGEVDIEGWDRPQVEVTVVRSTEHYYGSKDRTEAQRRLDGVQVTAKQDGSDVVVSTVYPPLNAFLHPLSRRSNIEINYLIKAPRASKLILDDHRGGVNVTDITGDIHARVDNGQITLTLPPSGHYAIDAQCAIGDVYSDFDGHDRRHDVIGQQYSSQNGSPAANLYLRVRVGDILIQKMHGPPTE